MTDNQEQTDWTEPEIVDKWLLEKSDSVLRSLSELVDFVIEQKELPENIRNFILAKTSAALHNATKIMSSAGQGGWTIDDRKLILEHGFGGYKALSAKYKNADLTYVTNWNDFSSVLEKLLDGTRTNRGSIHELLRRCIVKDQRVEYIRNLTESLTMGDVSWEEYVESIKNMS